MKDRNKAIFFDRDGVINEVVFRGSNKPSSPWKFEEFKLVSGIEMPLRELSLMGYYLFIVSNQPDISRGYIESGTTEKINDELRRLFPIHDIIICPHDDCHKCECRKPKPGMLLDLAGKWNVNLAESFLIGDNWKDIEAGRAAGCIAILIDTAYNQSVETDFRRKNLEYSVSLIKEIQLR